MRDISRRIVLKNGALALACVGAGVSVWGPSFVRQAAFAAESPKAAGKGGKVLICIFQRGAADGLSMVPPFGDEHYYKLRNEIALARPAKAQGDEATIDLDGFFGFHRALAPLAPIYRAKELAVIHACGSPNPNRSHFDAQDFMEAGVADDKSVETGWLNRALVASPEPVKRTPFRGVSMTSAVPRSLLGPHDVMAIPDLKTFGVQGAGHNDGGFEVLYNDAAGGADVVRGAGRESFDALRILKAADPTRYKPAHGAKYPDNPYGRALLQIAQLIKADIGVQVAFAESGGWDTHANQGAANGQLAGNLSDFARGIAALHTDLGERMADVVILTMTEFGRSVRQNGNRGTDHGRGACFLALGGSVNGGKVLGDWPGLAQEKLADGRDLAVTTDYRDVFAEVARKHLGATGKDLFPGYTADAKNEREVLKG
jgi:uncharacterized protein (DUF1501 family)